MRAAARHCRSAADTAAASAAASVAASTTAAAPTAATAAATARRLRDCAAQRRSKPAIYALRRRAAIL